MSVDLAARPVRPRPIIVAAILAAATLLLAVVTQVGAADAATARATRAGSATPASSSKPLVVLVHGAWADSGSWNGVVALLQRAGYTVYALPNPLRGLANDSATVADFLHTISGPVVLVGHSYGGAVITNAARGDANVKALVYVDAFVPAQGETLFKLTGAGSCFAVHDLSTVFNFVPFPGAPDQVLDAYVKQSVFPGCFANGLPSTVGAVLAATQRPLATSALLDESGAPAWESIPSWDVIGTADHVIPVDDQRAMAKRAHARATETSAPHLSMVTDPAVVAGVIVRAAQATS